MLRALCGALVELESANTRKSRRGFNRPEVSSRAIDQLLKVRAGAARVATGAYSAVAKEEAADKYALVAFVDSLFLLSTKVVKTAG